MKNFMQPKEITVLAKNQGWIKFKNGTTWRLAYDQNRVFACDGLTFFPIDVKWVFEVQPAGPPAKELN